MKRTEVISTAIAVAAIATASIAFTSKPYGQSYCAKTGTAGSCTNFLKNQRVDPAGNVYRGYLSTNPSCASLCSAEVKLLDQL
jgi:hypothetical protein